MARKRVEEVFARRLRFYVFWLVTLTLLRWYIWWNIHVLIGVVLSIAQCHAHFRIPRLDLFVRPLALSVCPLNCFFPKARDWSLTPITLVNSAIVHPSKPSFQWCRFHLPRSFNFWSVLQAPSGHLYFVSTTSTNPALLIRSFIFSCIRNVLPNRSPHSIANLPHSSHMSPGWMEPSSERGTGEISSCSRYPPGVRWLKKESAMYYNCMKSKPTRKLLDKELANLQQWIREDECWLTRRTFFGRPIRWISHQSQSEGLEVQSLVEFVKDQ